MGIRSRRGLRGEMISWYEDKGFYRRPFRLNSSKSITQFRTNASLRTKRIRARNFSMLAVLDIAERNTYLADIAERKYLMRFDVRRLNYFVKTGQSFIVLVSLESPLNVTRRPFLLKQ